VFTVLDWLEKSIRDSINSMGSNVIYVQKTPWSFDGNLAWWDIIRWPSISLNDYQAIMNKSTKAEATSLIIAQAERIKYRNNVANDAILAAVTNDLEKVISFEIDNGSIFSIEYVRGSNVTVMGAEIAERLFEMPILLAKK